MPAPRRISILGSTGSVGCNTIDLIERQPERYKIEALTANRNVALLAEQARRLRPRLAVIGDEARFGALKEALAGSGIELAAGPAALVEAAQRPAEWLMAAIVGAAGLEPTLAALRRGAIVALANKECLVCAGELMMEEVNRNGATLLPVDSEHNAIFQVFDFARRDAVERIILTASGGPFRTLDRAVMAHVTPAQAVAHPNWNMGAKISVDSATMMNKGLELIEAHHLFDLPAENIEVLIHPQSVVHSLVAYVDGSVLAQLGTPDMRTPIAYTLGWPERMPAPAERLDLAALGQLSFEPPDLERFPALRLARQALQSGGTAPTILNAANEVAVAGFLGGEVGFLEIAGIVEETLATMPLDKPASLDAVFAVDSEARRVAEELIARVRDRL
ncbi:MAG: 1-deoxy-D-xylulose-5-phosphate reductoisomerase [Alphaproteobacteria bacterium]|nr:1-deoxy-D-xylulose-5-phosphate reductoisomerase [Alphaproteobacteria bacterium]